MKLLIVSFYYHPEIGAAPSRMTDLAEGLQKQGAEVDVLTCLPNYPKGEIYKEYKGKFYNKEVINNINIFRYWTYATISKNPLLRAWAMISFSIILWCFAFKRSLIRSYDKVIIQSPPLFVSGSAILLFKCLYGKKTVLNISDLWPISAVELGAMREGGIAYKVFAFIEKFIYRKADAILGQSDEIIKHIDSFEPLKKKFLYRNLKHYEVNTTPRRKGEKVKIVYAGLLGVAQDILGIIQNIDFKKIGVDFHLFGGGNQCKKIEEFINNNDTGVFYHGYVSKVHLQNELINYDASIVPLAVSIKGAVPSKIFDLVAGGLPILFCGGGEGAEIVKDNNLGYVSAPGNYNELYNNIISLKNLDKDDYFKLSKNCLDAAQGIFDFDIQIKNCYSFIKDL